MKKVNFLLCVHNHQPTGNFDGVFEMACKMAYEPFLEVLERHPGIRLTLHFSGCLLDWMEQHRPATVERIAALVDDNRVELMGGGYYEPILAMLPDRDKIGQIESFREYLEKRFNTKIRGAWLTERVWEQSLTTPLVQAGVEYVIVDDSHFRNAGLQDDQLDGYYLTEDQGNLLSVFSGSERLRYLIPFDDPCKTIELLGSLADEAREGWAEERIVAYADDGEKFGFWPETHKLVYEEGWLDRFFDEIEQRAYWINLMTLGEAVDRFPPRGIIYLPDASYREMMEWAMPADTLMQLEDCTAQLKECGVYDQTKRFLRGGMWRNFKHKYPEMNDMYGRMLRISEKVKNIEGFDEEYRDAQMELYRSQCCCAWWHGVFGGLYLPHLRSAVYEHMLRAEAIADSTVHDDDAWLEAEIRDVNLDTKPEVVLSNGRLVTVFVPHRGGHLTEFSLVEAGVNLLSTITRRKEAYHRDVSRAQKPEEVATDDVQSIHDVILCKEHGLESLLKYDWYRREALIDHFFGPHTTLDAVADCEYDEYGDFVQEPYEFDLKRKDDRIWLQFIRRGHVRCPSVEQPFQAADSLHWQAESLPHNFRPISIEKVICFTADSSRLEVGYVLGNPGDEPIDAIFGVECNLAFLGCDEDNWQLRSGEGEPDQPIDRQLEIARKHELYVTDRLASLEVGLSWSSPADVWTFPIYSICNSEAGFEKTFQNLAIIPHWPVNIAPGGDWQLQIDLAIEPIRSAV